MTMNRIPSERQLETMGYHNQWDVLDVWARDLREEIDGIQSGYIIPWNGSTKSGLLAASRRRLKRVYRLADQFGHYVGQEVPQ